MKDKSWMSSILLCNNPIILVNVSEQDYLPLAAGYALAEIGRILCGDRLSQRRW